MSNPTLPVLSQANFSSFSAVYDGFNRIIQPTVSNHDFEFAFRKEFYGVFRAAVEFFVSFLSPEAFYVGYG